MQSERTSSEPGPSLATASSSALGDAEDMYLRRVLGLPALVVSMLAFAGIFAYAATTQLQAVHPPETGYNAAVMGVAALVIAGLNVPRFRTARARLRAVRAEIARREHAGPSGLSACSR